MDFTGHDSKRSTDWSHREILSSQSLVIHCITQTCLQQLYCAFTRARRHWQRCEGFRYCPSSAVVQCQKAVAATGVWFVYAFGVKCLSAVRSHFEFLPPRPDQNPMNRTEQRNICMSFRLYFVDERRHQCNTVR